MNTLDKLYNFNREYNNINETLMLSVLQYNKGNLDYAISDVDKFRPKFNVTELFYKLKTKFEKRFKVLEYGEGEQAYVTANIDNQGSKVAADTQLDIYVPTGLEDPLAYIVIKDFIRVAKFQDKIRRLESLLKRSKVSYTKTKAKVNGVNTIKLQTNALSHNERFWGALNLITKG